MIYVFDSSPLINLFKHYYQKRFPSLWEQFDELVDNNQIISVSLAFLEITDQYSEEDELAKWAKKLETSLFLQPTKEEMEFVADIFKIKHFRGMVERKKMLSGKQVADPFIIAKAACIEDGCVVTNERYKPHSQKIPNICKHYGIECYDLEQFMEKENWTF